MMNNICYIVGAGEVSGLCLDIDEGDYVIAADGGYIHLQKAGATPDLVVGDFDSLDKELIHPHIIRYAAEKDDTDMKLAVDEGMSRGYRVFVIYGGMGGRLDHTLANIQLLSYIAKHGARGYLLGGGAAVTAVRDGTLSFKDSLKGIISIFCIGEQACGVYLKGLKYELDNAVISSDVSVGISNEFIGVNSTVCVENGTLIVLWHEKPFDVINGIR